MKDIKEPGLDTIYRNDVGHAQVVDWCENTIARANITCTRETWETLAGPTHMLSMGDRNADKQIVFVPGTNFNSATSLHEIALLSTRHHVTMVDIPGQPGLSSSRRVHDKAALGAWLTEIVDRIAQPVILIGHSFGSVIVMAASSVNITGRILLSPAGISRLRTPPGLLWSSMRWLVKPSATTSRRLLEHMHKLGEKPSTDHVNWMTLVGQTTRTSFAPKPLPRTVLTEAAKKPLIIATGIEDVFLPPGQLRSDARRHLHSDVVTLPSGHLLNDEAWMYVRDIIITQIEELT